LASRSFLVKLPIVTALIFEYERRLVRVIACVPAQQVAEVHSVHLLSILRDIFVFYLPRQSQQGDGGPSVLKRLEGWEAGRLGG
jgi:hypothetical protein